MQKGDPCQWASVILGATFAATCAVLASPSSSVGPAGPAPRFQRIYAYYQNSRGESSPELVKEKEKLLEGLTGTVVELSPGVGANLKYLKGANTIIGIEANPFMAPYFNATAEALQLAPDWRNLTIHNMSSLEEGSVDAVVSTHALCSLRNVSTALVEIARVLKPGGILALVENVGYAEAGPSKYWQTLVSPFWELLADGCNLYSDLPSLLLESKLFKLDYRRVELETAPMPLMKPHLIGTAIKL